MKDGSYSFIQNALFNKATRDLLGPLANPVFVGAGICMFLGLVLSWWVPLVAFIIYAADKGQVAARDCYTGYVMDRGREDQKHNQRRNILDVLHQSDPEFDLEQFLGRCRTAFTRICEARSRQKLDKVESFISDGLNERLLLQIAEQKMLGYRPHMADLVVEKMAVAQVESDGIFDAVSVKFAAAATRDRVSLKNNRPPSGGERRRFIEYWTFLRRSGAKTRQGQAGLFEGNCPNCGAGIEVNAWAKCKYCRAYLRSGQHDWVLSEITQGCDWRGKSDKDIPGFNEIRRDGDEGINVAVIEDRASLMFWRKIKAEQAARPDSLRSIATDDYLKRYKRELPQMRGLPRGGRFCYADCSVSAVDTLGIVMGKEMDHAVVEIRWGGRRYDVDRNNHAKRKKASMFRSLYILQRKVGAKTNVDAGLSSAHCQNCGAPERTGSAAECEFCGSELSDRANDWHLVGTPPWADKQGQDWLRLIQEGFAALERRESRYESEGIVTVGAASLMAWMIRTALADGVVDEREMDLLRATAAKRNIPEERLLTMIEAVKDGTMEIPQPRSKKEVLDWMSQNARVCMQDGRISPQEKQVLELIGKPLGMMRYDIEMILKKERLRMYQEAREASALRNRNRHWEQYRVSRAERSGARN